MGRPKGSKNKKTLEREARAAGKGKRGKAAKDAPAKLRAKAPRQPRKARTAAFGKKKGGFLGSLTRARDASGQLIIDKDVNGLESYRLTETPGVIADTIPNVLAAIRPKNVNMVAILTDVKGRRALFSSSTGDKTDDRVLAAAGVFLRLFPRETLDAVIAKLDAEEAAGLEAEAQAAAAAQAAAPEEQGAVTEEPEETEVETAVEEAEAAPAAVAVAEAIEAAATTNPTLVPTGAAI